MSFKESKLYKEALEKYQLEIFNSILNPINIIVYWWDTVYLFYNQKIIEDVFNQMIKIYEDNNNDIETNFPVHLWYEKPELKTTTFMWVQYKAIILWYDKENPPKEFMAK